MQADVAEQKPHVARKLPLLAQRETPPASIKPPAPRKLPLLASRQPQLPTEPSIAAAGKYETSIEQAPPVLESDDDLAELIPLDDDDDSVKLTFTGHQPIFELPQPGATPNSLVTDIDETEFGELIPLEDDDDQMRPINELLQPGVEEPTLTVDEVFPVKDDATVELADPIPAEKADEPVEPPPTMDDDEPTDLLPLDDDEELSEMPPLDGDEELSEMPPLDDNDEPVEPPPTMDDDEPTDLLPLDDDEELSEMPHLDDDEELSQQPFKDSTQDGLDTPATLDTPDRPIITTASGFNEPPDIAVAAGVPPLAAAITVDSPIHVPSTLPHMAFVAQPIGPRPFEAIKVDPNAPVHILEVHELVKRFGRKVAVRKVSFSMRTGQITGLLGPNGAGKTTVFYMIVGFLRPTSGTVYLDHHKLSSLPMYRRARLGIAYLPQEPSVFRKMTVEQNIRSILETRTDLNRRRRKETLDHLLEEFGIKDLRKQPAYTLSGGERRRTEIARALAIEPKYLLLDEPFAGIDPIAVHEIKSIVVQLASQGIGVLITDHNVRDTLEITQEAHIINRGEILVSGDRDTILASETARQIYLGETFRM
jgi:lipopolysaccharide export system ATP-binding protein